MGKKGIPILTMVCLGAAFLYLVYATIGLFQDHYIGEHFQKAIDLQWRLEMFSLIMPFAVQIFQYKALRNIRVYLAWLIYSLILLGFYFAFMKDRSLIDDTFSSMNGFKALFAFLIWFQLCRRLSKGIYGTELVLPAQDMFQPKVDGKPFDTEDKRYLNVIDYIAVFGAWIIIPVCIFN